MRDIIGDAITFDMYYFAKAPSLAKTGGKVAIPSVDEGTPQFRRFSIENIICDGAARGVFFRGLPEMSIRDINIQNVRVRADAGMDIIEANNIKVDNVFLDCPKDKALIHIENSTNIGINYLNAVNTPAVLFCIDGDRSKAITVSHCPIANEHANNIFQYGAQKQDLTFK